MGRRWEVTNAEVFPFLVIVWQKKKNQSTTIWVTDKEDKVNSNCKNSAWEANIQRVNKSQINKPNFLML